MKKAKIGVVSFAHPHALSYVTCIKQLDNTELCGITDRDKHRGKEMAIKFGTKFYNSINELLSKANPDAVIVTSENRFHYQDCVPAAEEGVNILCEKPMTTRLEDAEKLVKMVNNTGIVFQMCYVMRYHRVALTVKELIEKEVIGNVKVMIGTNKLNITNILIADWFTNPDLSGGGAVMDHTVHLSDLMRWYCEKEARRVYSIVGDNIFKQLKVEDHFFTIIEFEDNVVGSIDGSWCIPENYPTWGEVGMNIYGDKGAIIIDAFNQYLKLISGRRNAKPIIYRYYGCNADLEMIREFAECVLNGIKETRADVVDGLRGVEITLASYESIKKGEAVDITSRI